MQTMTGRYHDFTAAEALAIAKRNDPGEKVPSVSRTLIAELEYLRGLIREVVAADCRTNDNTLRRRLIEAAGNGADA